MKASVLSLVFLSGLAAAQDGIPTCATGCVTQFTTGTSIAGCGQLDIACICKNADFLSGIACCLVSACDKDAQTQAVQYAKQICSSAGVSTPDQVVCNEKSSSSTEASHESTTASESSASTATTGSSDSSTTDSSESSTTAESSSTSATTNSASRTTATSAASQTTSAASTTSSNAAPLASAGSFVGAAIAVLAAAL
ncbi:cell wall protein [Trichoderma sp. SZMC 28013]